MASSQTAIKSQNDQNTYLILTSSIPSIASSIQTWVQNTASSIVTFAELISDVDFPIKDEELISKALFHLQSLGKAEVMLDEVDNIEGVKFFS